MADVLIQLLDGITDELDKPNTKFVQSVAFAVQMAFDRLQTAMLISKMPV